jgi:hypothetical protein
LAQKFTINNKDNQKENTIAQALGHFANNQFKDSIVACVQRGLWNLQIKSLPNDNNILIIIKVILILKTKYDSCF